MGNIWNKVLDAIKWLGRAAIGMRRYEGLLSDVAKSLGASEKIMKFLRRFFEKTEKVERWHGMHTSFWAKIQAAKANGLGCELTPEEVRYGFFFKTAFDDTIGKLGKKFRGDAEVEIDDMTPEEDSDDNLEPGQ